MSHGFFLVHSFWQKTYTMKNRHTFRGGSCPRHPMGSPSASGGGLWASGGPAWPKQPRGPNGRFAFLATKICSPPRGKSDICPAHTRRRRWINCVPRRVSGLGWSWLVVPGRRSRLSPARGAKVVGAFRTGFASHQAARESVTKTMSEINTLVDRLPGTPRAKTCMRTPVATSFYPDLTP